jgi:DNA-binding response OmpR family regulator
LRATFVFADDSSCAAHSCAGLSRAIEVTTTAAARLRRSIATLNGDVLVVDGRIAHAADLIKHVRAAHPTLPILFLAARPEDVPSAATAGANDFALAPASPQEIDLRIRMLSSASVRPLASVRRVGRLVLDRGKRCLSSDEKSVRLSPIELAVFERLLLEAGRPVSRADLERSIWGETESGEPTTNVAVVYVSYVRKKLAQLGGGCRIITHTQVGYALEIPTVQRPNPIPRAKPLPSRR